MSMSTEYRASLVVHFGDAVAESAFYLAEFDSTMNVDSAGEAKTQFEPGDDIYFYIQHDADLRIDKVIPTAGQVVGEGTGRRAKTDWLSFGEAAKAAELSAIPYGAVTPAWQQGVTGLNAREGSGFSVSGRSVTVTGNVPCACNASYQALMHLYRLVSPNMTLAESESCIVEIHIYFEAVSS